MGHRTKYAPGAFCWTDLTTDDQEGSKAFYAGLFGWEATDNPVGEGIVYSMMSIEGQNVAAISPQPERQREAGVPPTWNSYISVESADAVLQRAGELGANIHAPAFDVLDAGRMGVIQDPQGAYFLVWESKLHIGASLVNAHGALSWNELASPDLDVSASFYSDLFGWQIQSLPGAPMPYMTIMSSGHGNGGIRPAMPPGTAPHWLVYFGCDELDATAAEAEMLGAKLLGEKVSIGPGEIVTVQDPQGAMFALYAGRLDP
ncbi:MAG: VOC family protein [Solirubrobacteraceae bacterium]